MARSEATTQSGKDFDSKRFISGMGYKQLEISGTRRIGANPGRDVFMRFDLTRFREGG